jgi:glycosyltransferase involved in cell wall biosynthesis
MKIAMVTAFWGPVYPTGSGIYACEIARRLAEKGNEVHVYTSSVGNLTHTENPDNLHVHILQTHGVVWNMNPIANVFTELLREDFDIVHVHSYIFFMSNMAAMARILRNFRYILHFHGGLNYHKAKMFHPWRVWAKEKIYDRTLGLLTVKMADKVLSVAKSDIPIIKEKFGVDAEWIPNAVCTNKFSYTEKNSRTVTYVGKLEKWKGAEVLMEVFEIVRSELSDVEFMIAGDGTLAEKFGKANKGIKFLGHIPHDKMPEVYHKTAVLVSPSFMEGSPTICMESLACGTPVVGTDVGDTREMVIDRKTGFLVMPGNAEAIASRVIELLENRALRRTMGEEGRRHIEENFSYDVIVKKICDVYRSLV